MDIKDIADFAESILENDSAKGKPVIMAAPSQQPNAPDISDIVVPADFASQILTEGKWSSDEIDKNAIASKPKPKVDEKTLYKRELIQEYKRKVSELEDLVQEMTGAGIGTGTGLGLGGGAVAAPGVSVSRRRKHGRSNRTSTRRKKKPKF